MPSSLHFYFSLFSEDLTKDTTKDTTPTTNESIVMKSIILISYLIYLYYL